MLARLTRRAIAGLLLGLAAVLFVPEIVLARAGIAEFEIHYAYSDHTELVMSHGDLCGGDCLYLKKPKGPLLEEVSVPEPSSTPFVLAKTWVKKTWIVADTSTDRTLLETPDREEALRMWRSLGLGIPRMATALTVDKYFKKIADTILFSRNWLEYRYNALTDLWWERSDYCSERPGFMGECFYLTKDPGRTLLKQVSLPASDTGPMVLGECVTGGWVVLNLEAGKAGGSPSKSTREAALARWRELGLPEPKFAQRETLAKLFPKTDKTKKADRAEYALWGIGLTFMAVAAGTVLLPLALVGLLVYFVVKALKRRA